MNTWYSTFLALMELSTFPKKFFHTSLCSFYESYVQLFSVVPIFWTKIFYTNRCRIIKNCLTVSLECLTFPWILVAAFQCSTQFFKKSFYTNLTVKLCIYIYNLYFLHFWRCVSRLISRYYVVFRKKWSAKKRVLYLGLLILTKILI